jgi:hypothetical protein
VRLLARLLVVAAFASLPAGIAFLSCSTGAVGVQACQSIEFARCVQAPLCTPGFNVNQCELFYRDECLVGIENSTPDADPSTLAPACVQALDAVAACVQMGADAGCFAGYLAFDASPDAACNDFSTDASLGCNLILNCPEALTACNFLAALPDGGSDADADAEATVDADADPPPDADTPDADAGTPDADMPDADAPDADDAGD